ncbi:lipopolysaccharide-induced tumor necrosis factor-alpha factor homolog [Musca domestica]|uniref:Lipopolysaccharide-induced tumor necrosis factor-alpha factor homolog n=1 Tax=Musca domestica TaxID=7370 RepID=A0A1I8N011_MUSDO|nr:lipopolysaccharide-induced tumor necrosis factor-alpha factor homolog [Musca domestica]
MSDEANKRVYPSAPLEEVVHTEQQQHLLAKPAPPSYDQAIGAEPITHQPGQPTTAGDPHVVVITQPTTVYGPTPVDVQCPYCHNICRTRLRAKPNSRTHLFALILCLLQLYCCVCLPYCIASCMDTNHYCGMCDRYLGTYQRA